MFDSIVWAMGSMPQNGQPEAIGRGVVPFLPLIIIFVIFYFLLIRPQQKREKRHRQMIESLKKGDKVITSGGIYGVVESVNENTVILKIAENVKIKLAKNYIIALRHESMD